MNPLTPYFYRVYVMNGFGRMGGSNIESATTLNENLIVNGSFDSLTQEKTPYGWIVNPEVFSVDSTDPENGKFAIKGNCEKYLVELGGGSLRQNIPYIKLQPGMAYTFSFWYYVVNLEGNSNMEVKLGDLNYTFIAAPSSTAWQKYSFDFTAPANVSTDIPLEIRVQVNIPFNGERWIVMIDNFELYRQ